MFLKTLFESCHKITICTVRFSGQEVDLLFLLSKVPALMLLTETQVMTEWSTRESAKSSGRSSYPLSDDRKVFWRRSKFYIGRSVRGCCKRNWRSERFCSHVISNRSQQPWIYLRDAPADKMARAVRDKVTCRVVLSGLYCSCCCLYMWPWPSPPPLGWKVRKSGLQWELAFALRN